MTHHEEQCAFGPQSPEGACVQRIPEQHYLHTVGELAVTPEMCASPLALKCTHAASTQGFIQLQKSAVAWAPRLLGAVKSPNN